MLQPVGSRLKAARAGETVVVASRSKPVAKLVPVDEGESAGSGSVDDIPGWLNADSPPEGSRRSAKDIDRDLAAVRRFHLSFDLKRSSSHYEMAI